MKPAEKEIIALVKREGYKMLWNSTKKDLRVFSPIYNFAKTQKKYTKGNRIDYKSCFEDLLLWISGIYTYTTDQHIKDDFAPILQSLIEAKARAEIIIKKTEEKYGN
jgi:hypothetical protein